MNKKLLFTLPLIGCILTGCKAPVHYTSDKYFKTVEWINHDEDFRILQLCDIHLSQSDIYERHLALINETINRANADLIVINGDSFTYADKKVVNLLFGFIDGKDIPWTFTYGNHDDQGYYSDSYIQRLLASGKFKNVRFVNLEDDDVTGRSNFVINIDQIDRDLSNKVISKKTRFQVYLFESHSYNFDTLAYDFLKQDQIDWYKRMVDYSTSKFGDNAKIPSAAYFHIPTPEFFTAWNERTEESVILGSTDEMGGGPTPTSDTHIFDVMKELGSTIAISCAHDHVNDSVLKYKDMYLCFGVHSTDRIYYDSEKLGGQVISVSKTDPSKLSFENIKLSYSEVEDK